jgi:hypothetical protein
VEIVKSISIENLVNQRQAILAKADQAIGLLKECQALGSSAGTGFPRMEIQSSYRPQRRTFMVTGDFMHAHEEIFQEIVRTVDAGAWNHLMHESGLKTFMDAAAREKWDKQVIEGVIPELTAANIWATFGQNYDARGEMFERGVLACFRSLSWNYKTNLPFKFGKRIILAYFCSYGSPNHDALNKLDDLVRVLHVLDGKREPDHRQGMHCLVWDARHAGNTELETDYLHLRWFKKGSAHITFKRQDLVEKMNQILAKHYPNALADGVRK